MITAIYDQEYDYVLSSSGLETLKWNIAEGEDGEEYLVGLEERTSTTK